MWLSPPTWQGKRWRGLPWHVLSTQVAFNDFAGLWRLGSVLLLIEVDENVIGGMSVDLGTHVFESTVAGRLDEVRRLLN